MVVDNFIPNRGDIMWMNMSPQSGHEQAGRRPVFVLSPRRFNQITGFCFVCPITHQIKGYPFELVLPTSSDTRGVLLLDHTKSLDWRSRNAEYRESTGDIFTDKACEVVKLIFSR